VFDANSDTHPSMWASHPRDYEREQNCKAVYIRSDVDDRSAWELFVDPRRVRERVTDQLWRQRVGHTGALHPAADVQRFIDDERAELLHDERYGGYYEGRTLYVGDHAAVFEQVRLESANTAQTRGEYETLYDQAFSRQAAAGRHLKEEFSKLLRTLQSGEKIRNLSFRGAKHQVEDIDHIMEVLGGELDEFSAWEDEHDTAVLRVHAQMASDLGDESWLDELEHRYQFQTVIQQTLREAGEAKQLLASGLEPLGKGELDEMEAQMVYETLRAVRQQLAEIMERAGRTRIPALTNFESTKLGEFLLVDPLVHDLYAIDGLTGDWINQLASQGQQLEDRARRLAGKGVGGILACQEAIAALWTSTHSDEGAESVA
jgi:hypothetical protein